MDEERKSMLHPESPLRTHVQSFRIDSMPGAIDIEVGASSGGGKDASRRAKGTENIALIDEILSTKKVRKTCYVIPRWVVWVGGAIVAANLLSVVWAAYRGVAG